MASARTERVHQSALEIARYRQAWINDLRSDFASYASLHTKAHFEFSDADFAEMMNVGCRILMRMNPDDADFTAVETCIDYAISCASTPKDEMKKLEEKYPHRESIVLVGRRVLKREWERLKKDLREAEK